VHSCTSGEQLSQAAKQDIGANSLSQLPSAEGVPLSLERLLWPCFRKTNRRCKGT